MIAVWIAFLSIAEGALITAWHHYKIQLVAVLAAVAAWVVHRARRRVTSTGARVEGMPLLEPVAVRRPDLAPKPKTTLEATA